MLDIAVVGAGIAGLAAAIALRRAGHRVRVYERSAMNNEVGAAINVPPNAARFLVRWGLDPRAERFVRAGPVQFLDPWTLEVTTAATHADNARKFGGADLWLAHRVDLHGALKRLATEAEGPGVPVEILLGSRVVGYVGGHALADDALWSPAPSLTMADMASRTRKSRRCASPTARRSAPTSWLVPMASTLSPARQFSDGHTSVCSQGMPTAVIVF
jgi:2-polyprenyl-6-methoxyphenol hydroxylase-like FAD-dependent oxidoreductase